MTTNNSALKQAAPAAPCGACRRTPGSMPDPAGKVGRVCPPCARLRTPKGAAVKPTPAPAPVPNGNGQAATPLAPKPPAPLAAPKPQQPKDRPLSCGTVIRWPWGEAPCGQSVLVSRAQTLGIEALRAAVAKATGRRADQVSGKELLAGLEGHARCESCARDLRRMGAQLYSFAGTAKELARRVSLKEEADRAREADRRRKQAVKAPPLKAAVLPTVDIQTVDKAGRRLGHTAAGKRQVAKAVEAVMMTAETARHQADAEKAARQDAEERRKAEVAARNIAAGGYVGRAS